MVHQLQGGWFRPFMGILLAGVLFFVGGSVVEAGPSGVPEEHVFPYLVIPVILFMGVSIYIVLKAEENEDVPVESGAGSEGEAQDDGEHVEAAN